MCVNGDEFSFSRLPEKWQGSVLEVNHFWNSKVMMMMLVNPLYLMGEKWLLVHRTFLTMAKKREDFVIMVLRNCPTQVLSEHCTANTSVLATHVQQQPQTQLQTCWKNFILEELTREGDSL